MMPTEISRLRSNGEWMPEGRAALELDEDMALLFYALLDDEDLKEVFGEFLVPAESAQ